MDLSFSLMYYKRKEVQSAIVREAQDKECSVRFINEGFGKRPDILTYENDVLELAKKKATSFHCSEELWFNPLALSTGMKRRELDDLRKGWDLILDIDCPEWELSKLTTHLFIKALEAHGVKTIFCKFSGNKGFHIAVPFEAFPQKVSYEGQTVFFKNLFPEGARKIALYLLSYITENFAKINNEYVVFLDQFKFSFKQLQAIAKKNSHSLIAYRCQKCKSISEESPKSSKLSYTCIKCGKSFNSKTKIDILPCPSCGYPVQPNIEKNICKYCKIPTKFDKIFNFFAVVDVDTILIASRHLYRMPYSLHEKSKLVSIPVDKSEILNFKKESAQPEHCSFEKRFMFREKAQQGEASKLVLLSFDSSFKEYNRKIENIQKEIELPPNALSEEFFPPCIQKITKGLQDGKKRALFVLLNFLRMVGWSLEQIEEYVHEWNSKNPEPLREQYIKGQLSQIKQGKKPILPPSCSNKSYYEAIQICSPDEFCQHIKNPSQYAQNKSKLNPSKKLKPKNKIEKTIPYILIVDEKNIQKEYKKLDQITKKDLIRKCVLIIKNSADGLLLVKDITDIWIFPLQTFVQKKETEVNSLKRIAKEKLGLRTFFPRELKLPKNLIKTENKFNYFFYAVVDRHINNFNPSNSFKEIKWFSKSELLRKLKQDEHVFSKEIQEILKLNI